MKNFEIARLFDLMADVLELGGENVFRIRAYRRAARNVEALSEDVEILAQQDRLDEIPGVGRDLAGKIAEYLKTGRVKDIDAATRRVPAGVVALMRVPGIGPKTARMLHEQEGITTLERLEKLAFRPGPRPTSSRASRSCAAGRREWRWAGRCRSGASW